VKKWLESVRTAVWNKMISDALAPIITALKDFFVKMVQEIAKLPGAIWDAIKGNFENFMKNISYTGGGSPGGDSADRSPTFRRPALHPAGNSLCLGRDGRR
jgi:hypothetical protein